MITIREATIDDLQTLQAIGIETYKEHFSDIWTDAGLQTFLSEDFSACKLQKSIESPAHHCWLIALNEKEEAVGFSRVNWSKPIPMSDQIGAELQKIYFLKSQAGKGYGKQLLQFIQHAAQNRNEGFLWLDVLKTNSNAQRFYESYGFRALSEIPFSTDKAEIGMIVMCHDLSR
ncbi:GNAT family N-acetyltransferase [Pseudomonas khavaziana]|uniref:GNAT family N-acetyltransferase n=1 Tax=Pseudomonas khavaziana TaxID=2842351 RepID=UPI001C3C31DA|nr:N-acetyltransferase [Pseudomonas khavaziana]MBV4481776.1 GNAT family N-acetyltransferase [Pseudomonas khavaziana]